MKHLDFIVCVTYTLLICPKVFKHNRDSSEYQENLLYIFHCHIQKSVPGHFDFKESGYCLKLIGGILSMPQTVC